MFSSRVVGAIALCFWTLIGAALGTTFDITWNAGDLSSAVAGVDVRVGDVIRFITVQNSPENVALFLGSSPNVCVAANIGTVLLSSSDLKSVDIGGGTFVFFYELAVNPGANGLPGAASFPIRLTSSASCTSLLITEIRLITDAPTKNPTASPTRKPTVSPTTSAPTLSPSFRPTRAPSATPTESPLVKVSSTIVWKLPGNGVRTSEQAFLTEDESVLITVLGVHNFIELKDEQHFIDCDFTDQISKVSSTTVEITVDPGQTRFFACDVLDGASGQNHCQLGMKMAITGIERAFENLQITWELPPALDTFSNLNLSLGLNQVIEFDIQGEHDIVQFATKAAFDACDFSTGNTVLSQLGQIGTFLYRDILADNTNADFDVLWFGCSKGVQTGTSHCDKGMKIALPVNAIILPPTQAPTRAPVVVDLVDTPIDWVLPTVASRFSQVGFNIKNEDITFNVGAGHNLFKFPSQAAFTACDFSSATKLAGPSETVKVTGSKVGETQFLACAAPNGTGGHCRQNMKIALKGIETVFPDFEFTWTVPVGANAGLLAFYQEKHQIQKGQKILFNAVGTHDIVQFPNKAAFDACDFSNVLFQSDAFTDSSLAFRDPLANDELAGFNKIYLACSKGANFAHCKSGMKIAFDVVGEPTLAPTQSPIISLDTVFKWILPSQSIRFSEKLFLTEQETITFKVNNAAHHLLEFPNKAAFEACNFVNANFLAADGTEVVSVDVGETRYFGCNVSNHCVLGMKTAVSGLKRGDTFDLPWFRPSNEVQKATFAGPNFLAKGDVIFFQNTAVVAHNVIQLFSKQDFDECNFNNANNLLIANEFTSAVSYRDIFANDLDANEDVLWFACNLSDHCAAGQKIAFQVVADNFVETDAPTISEADNNENAQIGIIVGVLVAVIAVLLGALMFYVIRNRNTKPRGLTQVAEKYKDIVEVVKSPAKNVNDMSQLQKLELNSPTAMTRSAMGISVPINSNSTRSLNAGRDSTKTYTSGMDDDEAVGNPSLRLARSKAAMSKIEI